MILVDWDEILSWFAKIFAVLETHHELYFAIIHEKFYIGKVGSLFSIARIPLCWDESFSCNCFSLPKPDEIVYITHAYSGKIKENVNTSKQISRGKLSCFAWMKFDFPMLL